MGTDFFDELGETITRTAKELGEKAEAVYETQRMRNKIASEEHSVDKIMATMGSIIYKRFTDGEEVDKELAGYCRRVKEHKDNIEKSKEEMASRKGKKICPACKKEVDMEVAFCPYCGSPCPTPEPEPEPEAEAEETAEEEVTEEATEEAPAEEHLEEAAPEEEAPQEEEKPEEDSAE